MGASILRFPLERARAGSDVLSMLGYAWRDRRALNASDWVYIVGLAIDGTSTDRDRHRLGRIADRLQEAGR